MIDLELKYQKKIEEAKIQNICGNAIPMLHLGTFGWIITHAFLKKLQWHNR